MKAKHVFAFIASKCIPKDKIVSLAIGSLHTHPPHTIVLYGGVLICTQCGSTARSKLIKLQHKCFGKGSETGVHCLDNLERYSQGRAPRVYVP